MLSIVNRLFPADSPVHWYVGGPGSLFDSHVTATLSPVTTNKLSEIVCDPTLKVGVSGGSVVFINIEFHFIIHMLCN